MTTSRPLGLYIHIPFCERKCNYCDFVSFAGCDEAARDAYIDALCREIDERAGEFRESHRVDTIFIGGGTPSLLEPAQIDHIISRIRESFDCEEPGNMEISMEANPGSFGAEKLSGYIEAGVNRLSIGVQSLDDDVLKRLGRIHSADTARHALRAARGSGINYSTDIMLGVPDMSSKCFEDTLEELIEMQVPHISFYSLQLEMGTPFYRDFKDGKLSLPSHASTRAMYRRAVEMLKAAGYHHYEISNAAKPGFECRHNLKYWTMQDYLGLGMAAHSFVGGRRSFSTSNFEEYLACGADSIEFEESEIRDLKTDFVFTELRLMDGFDEGDYEMIFGSSYEEDFGRVSRELESDGLLERTERGWRLSPDGVDENYLLMERLINE
ncbi:MAG: radical SAM family heme chaperone HemW [Clostridiales bacterium]|nr:radical SAM family heme chaperone HemW [Clostridiales bacterium]